MCAIRFLINLLNIPLWFIRAFASQCQTQPFSRYKTEFHLLKQRTYFCHTYNIIVTILQITKFTYGICHVYVQQFLFQVKTQSTFKASPAKNRNFCEMYYSRKKLHISVMSDQMILVNADSLIAAQVIFCCKKY